MQLHLFCFPFAYYYYLLVLFLFNFVFCQQYVQDFIPRGEKKIPLYRSSLSSLSASDILSCIEVHASLTARASNKLCISPFSCLFFLDSLVENCSRVVDTHSPMAIVIPNRASNLSIELRDGDISWPDFLDRVKDFK